MNAKNNYKTKQQAMILSCLSSVREQHVTVAEILEYCRTQNLPVGITTIYRQLDKLTAQGLVQKFVTGGTAACYQYLGGEARRPVHFHLKCLCCGKFIHMECSMLAQLQAQLQLAHDFEIEPGKTTFYGRCGDCLRKNS